MTDDMKYRWVSVANQKLKDIGISTDDLMPRPLTMQECAKMMNLPFDERINFVVTLYVCIHIANEMRKP